MTFGIAPQATVAKRETHVKPHPPVARARVRPGGYCVWYGSQGDRPCTCGRDGHVDRWTDVASSAGRQGV